MGLDVRTDVEVLRKAFRQTLEMAEHCAQEEPSRYLRDTF